MRRRTDGFTLVELMVVVLVVGILVAIAVPVFKSAKADAERNTCFANQRMIYAAVETCVAMNPDRTERSLISGSDGLPYLVPTYLKSMPRCPSITDHATYHYYWGVYVDEKCYVWMSTPTPGVVRGCTVHGAFELQ